HSHTSTALVIPLSTLLRSTLSFFFFHDPATTEIYTLSLHDALPISTRRTRPSRAASTGSSSIRPPCCAGNTARARPCSWCGPRRSEEHTSELQSPCNLVCRLLLEKKKKKKQPTHRIVESTYGAIYN